MTIMTLDSIDQPTEAHADPEESGCCFLLSAFCFLFRNESCFWMLSSVLCHRAPAPTQAEAREPGPPPASALTGRGAKRAQLVHAARHHRRLCCTRSTTSEQRSRVGGTSSTSLLAHRDVGKAAGAVVADARIGGLRQCPRV